MIGREFIASLYHDSYSLIKQQVEGIGHRESLYQPVFGGNCVNWILGHIIVSRCNFMMMLGVPSLWDMTRCRRFIPGSAPITAESDALPFATLCADFDATQEQLLAALDRASDGALRQISGKKTIVEHLVFYNAHEANHAGQLEILCRMIKNGKIDFGV